MFRDFTFPKLNFFSVLSTNAFWSIYAVSHYSFLKLAIKKKKKQIKRIKESDSRGQETPSGVKKKKKSRLKFKIKNLTSN